MNVTLRNLNNFIFKAPPLIMNSTNLYDVDVIEALNDLVLTAFLYSRELSEECRISQSAEYISVYI